MNFKLRETYMKIFQAGKIFYTIFKNIPDARLIYINEYMTYLHINYYFGCFL